MSSGLNHLVQVHPLSQGGVLAGLGSSALHWYLLQGQSGPWLLGARRHPQLLAVSTPSPWPQFCPGPSRPLAGP